MLDPARTASRTKKKKKTTSSPLIGAPVQSQDAKDARKSEIAREVDAVPSSVPCRPLPPHLSVPGVLAVSLSARVIQVLVGAVREEDVGFAVADRVDDAPVGPGRLRPGDGSVGLHRIRAGHVRPDLA